MLSDKISLTRLIQIGQFTFMHLALIGTLHFKETHHNMFMYWHVFHPSHAWWRQRCRFLTFKNLWNLLELFSAGKIAEVTVRKFSCERFLKQNGKKRQGLMLL